MNALLFGPIRPCQDLHGHSQLALKMQGSERDFFTDVTLDEVHPGGGMRVEYTVTASSPKPAERAGAVYVNQLCDLLSVVTRSPVRLYLPDEDSNDERMRFDRRSTSVDRILTQEEWSWITGNLVLLRKEHPRFLAAASWYRKALIGSDSLSDFCCFWRVIERAAFSYADRSTWSEEDKSNGPAKKCVAQLVSDLFDRESIPEILAYAVEIATIEQLHNDLSHGNIPITLEVVETANAYLKPLEEAAYAVLIRIKQSKLAYNFS